MIKFSDLTLIYPAKPVKVIANRGINLEIKPSGVLVITGPNGSGKSSLLKIIAGSIAPSAGVVEVDGQVVADEKVAKVLADLVEYSPQDISLNPELSGRKLLKQVAGFEGLLFEKIIKSLKIEKIWDIPIKELTRDLRQLIAITLSLLSAKKYLLLDEPTKYLDNQQRDDLLKVLQQVAKGKSILIATHDLDWSTRVKNTLHIQDGKVVSVKGVRGRDSFGWQFTGVITKPNSLNRVKKHKNITQLKDLSSFTAAFAAVKGEVKLFDPEVKSYDQLSAAELFRGEKIKLPENLIPHSNQVIESLSGGERSWIYLSILLAKPCKQLFLLYPSLNLDQTNGKRLQDLIWQLANRGCQITIFDGN